MENILEILKGYGIETVQDGYITLPKSHCFATWRIGHRQAKGADNYNMYWEFPVELRICYRDDKTTDDWAWEKRLESDMQDLENLESDYTYDNQDKLEITVYTFTARENFEMEE